MYIWLNLCRNGFTIKSQQVFGTKNSPSPHNTLDGFAHLLELCNYHDRSLLSTEAWLSWLVQRDDDGICQSKPLVNNTALYCKGCVKIDPYLPHHYCLTAWTTHPLLGISLPVPTKTASSLNFWRPHWPGGWLCQVPGKNLMAMF